MVSSDTGRGRRSEPKKNTGVWIVDANEVDIEYIFDEDNSFLHLNNDIRHFLEVDNKATTIVIAPKGYGKTLLLMAKCKSVRNENLYRHVIPSDESLIDQPFGLAYVVNGNGKDDIRDKVDYWHTLWQIAFGVTIAKETGGLDYLLTEKRDRRISQVLYGVLKDPAKKSTADIFAKLTALNVGEYSKIRDDCLNHINPMLKETNLSVAIFVDGLDQYYEEILREDHKNSINRIAGNQHKVYWYLSQLGLAISAWEINRSNKHIKVYVSIRKEVLQKADSSMHFGLQLRGKSLIVQYTVRDLENIIAKNIGLERADRLCRPGLRHSAPVEAFFGELKDMVHPVTGDAEPVADFWLRHTLGRPRDIAAIGFQLSMIDPKERTAENVREKIRATAQVLAGTYIGEMQPHLNYFDHNLLCPLIKKNAMDADDLAAIAEEYDRRYGEAHHLQGTPCEIFRSLFKVGLIGYVIYDAERGEHRQIFRSPGEELLDDGAALPIADTYLVHPVLSEIIFTLNPDYYKGLNKTNIVGPNRIWHMDRQISYILYGDVVKSTKFNEEGGQEAFEVHLRDLVERHTRGLEHHQVENGDSVKLLHQNPIVLLRIGNILNSELLKSDFASHFRFAGDAGFLSVKMHGNNPTVIGDAVRRSSRVVPYVKPGEIYVTEKFYEHAQPRFATETVSMLQCGTSDMHNPNAQPLDMKEGEFNFSKEHENGHYTKIYRVDFF
jgi:hypothetical protein